RTANGPFSSTDVNVMLATDSVVLVGAGCGIHCSTDEGSSWQVLRPGAISCGAVYQGDIYVGQGGLHQLLPVDGVWNDVPVGAVGNVMDLLAADVLMAASLYQGFQSSADGVTWLPNNDGLPRDSVYNPNLGMYVYFVNTYALAVDVEQRYIGTPHGTYRSPLGGGAWEAANSGLPDATVTELASDGPVLLAAIGPQLFRSADQGLSWTLVVDLPTAPRFNDLVAIDGTFYASTEGDGSFSSADGLVWQQAHAGTVTGTFLSVGGTLLIGKSNGVFTEADGLALNNGLVCCTVTDLAMIDNTVVANERKAVHATTGGAWNPVSGGLDIAAHWDVAVVQDQFLISTIPSGLGPAACINYRAPASAAPWTPVSTLVNYGDPYALSSNGERVVAFTDDRLFLSEDQGTTWSDISPPGGLVCNNFNDAGWWGDTLFVLGCSFGDVIRSADLGATWQYANTGLPTAEPYLFRALPFGLFVATYQGLFVSTDNGVNWTSANTGLPPDFSSFPSSYIQDIVATANGLVLCTNNAVFAAGPDLQWADLTEGLPPLPDLYTGALLVRNDTLWFGTNSFGVWQLPLADLGLGTPERATHQVLALHPNPASTSVHIEAGGTLRHVLAVDLAGKRVELTALGGGRYALQALAPGLYSLYATTTDGRQGRGRLVVLRQRE
ncbi:MAG: hypothetical protein R2818_16005, partial [Flavobacteriales bacterium]